MSLRGLDGVRLAQTLEDNLEVWGEYFPHDFPDPAGHGMSCKKYYDDQVGVVARKLVLYLEDCGRIESAEIVRRQFDELSSQASAADLWCEANPCPSDIGFYWPAETVLEAIGDADFRVFSRCFDVLREIKASLDKSYDSFSAPENIVESSNDLRDSWMDEEWAAGKSLHQIMCALNTEHPEWEQIESVQGVGQAIRRYRKRKDLPRRTRRNLQ